MFYEKKEIFSCHHHPNKSFVFSNRFEKATTLSSRATLDAANMTDTPPPAPQPASCSFVTLYIPPAHTSTAISPCSAHGTQPKVGGGFL